MERELWKVYAGKRRFRFSSLPAEIKAYISHHILNNKLASTQLKFKYKHSLNIEHSNEIRE